MRAPRAPSRDQAAPSSARSGIGEEAMPRFPREASRPGLEPFSACGRRLAAGFKARLTGPGGYYNIGNAVALLTGVALHRPAEEATRESALGMAIDYLAGSASAVALTIATLV